MNIENADTFGNYMIHGIDEILLPEAVSWWPPAPGWVAAGIIIGVLLIVQLFRVATRWWRNRYRREALRQLDQLQQRGELPELISKLPYYIKATALQAYPRHEVAGLSGDNWLVFLDAHCPGSSFREGVGQNLLPIAYQPKEQWHVSDDDAEQLIHMSRHWIANHQVLNHV